MIRTTYLFMLLVLLSGCAAPGRGTTPTQNATASPVPATVTRQADLPTHTPTASPGPTATVPSSPTPDTRLSPQQWQEWPVVPLVISARALEIYQKGLALGNNPRSFSKIGDCESTPTWFLGMFDGRPDGYALGKYASLQSSLDYFQGSYGRTSLAAGRGFSSANVITALWADPKSCRAGETPLACELRENRPAFAFVMLGTNDVYHQEAFTANMHKILDTLIEQGVVPILATKADNLEGDHAVNAAIVRLAYEYDIPLWNFWLAVQPLPSRGLQLDGSHLTTDYPFFDDPVRMLSAWPWRNLTALQVLDLLRRVVSSQ